jgi:hypothetical protein
VEIGVVRRRELVVLDVQPWLSLPGLERDGVLDGRVGLQRHADAQPIAIHPRDGLPLFVGPRFTLHDRRQRHQLELGHVEGVEPRIPLRLPVGLEPLGHEPHQLGGAERERNGVGLGPEKPFERGHGKAQRGRGHRAVARGGEDRVARDAEALPGECRQVEDGKSLGHGEPARGLSALRQDVEHPPGGESGAELVGSRAHRPVRSSDPGQQREPEPVADDAVRGQRVGDRREAAAGRDAHPLGHRVASAGDHQQQRERGEAPHVRAIRRASR